MEYQEIKDWLDRIIFIQAAAVSCEDFNSSIQAIISQTNKKRIQLYIGIEIVADVMGIQLDSRERTDGMTEYFFTYSGFKFFQLGNSDKVDKSDVEEGE